MPLTPSYFGLTGGVACGKSTAASRFAELGAKIIDADQIGHDLMLPQNPAYTEIIKHFGRKVLNPHGEIDRKALGALVFADPEKRRKLNAILHPRIILRQEDLAAQYHSENPFAVIVIDAALIYEANAGNRFRKIIVAWCTLEQQIQRLMAKSDMSRGEAVARVAAQMPAEEKRRRADFVIDCSGSLAETRAQVDEIYPRLARLVSDQSSASLPER